MKKIFITLIIAISLMFIPKVYAYDVDYTQHNTIMASAWLDLGLGGNVGPLQVSTNYPTGAWYGTAQNYTFTSPGLSEQEGPFKMAFVYSSGNPCGSNSGYIKGELSLWQNNDFSSRVSRVYLKNSNNEELICNYTALSSAVIQYECSFGRSGFTSLEAEFGIDLQTGATMVGRPIYSRGTSYACNSGTDTTTIENNQQTIINQNSSIINNQTTINNNITNDNTTGATSDAGSFFSGFTTNTHGLTSIITAPLTLIGSITSASCSPLGLPLPYINKTLQLPCMSSIYSQYFGSFFTLYQTITTGIIAYWVIVRIFNLVKDFKNPEHDEIEVVDL